MPKTCYLFSQSKTEADKSMKLLVGGKGVGLAEMTRLKIPVPPGFTISTQACELYYKNGGKVSQDVMQEVYENLRHVEKESNKKFGDDQNPLLLSVRSGAAVSMPGMMDTILNLGLNTKSVEGLAKKTNNRRFAFDSYRRFIHMFATTVLNMEHKLFEDVLEEMKHQKKVKLDTDLTTQDLEAVCAKYKQIYLKEIKQEFPECPKQQLEMSINAVFGSWNSQRANSYRAMNNIRGLAGTAVNVQTMVFGNMGNSSGTGVAFTRNPIDGNNKIFADFLLNAQGEDVVAGIRTPHDIQYMNEVMPKAYEEFVQIVNLLEKFYKDMQDIEFTIEEGKLYILQTRSGKRTAQSALKIAVDMVQEKMITKEEALLRVDPSSLDQLLHFQISPAAIKKSTKLGRNYVTLQGKGLNASPGAATGQIVFNSQDAKNLAAQNKKSILVRLETSPEDIEGMNAAQGVLTARGGMTSHAAVVARGMGKCCICGWDDIKEIEGDFLTLNGTTGDVYEGLLELVPPNLDDNASYKTLMQWADQFRKLGIRTNADTPQDVRQALALGAEGIGLCRTEHMFFKKERIEKMRYMILTESEQERQKALQFLFAFQKEDFLNIFKIMGQKPVTIRLLDPPLHEFLPQKKEEIETMSQIMNISVNQIHSTIEKLHEFNPMLGHRGCRLGITFPEITEMQSRAIFEAAAEAGICMPEIMVPLVGFKNELVNQKLLVQKIHKECEKKYNKQIPYLFGTMIEVPRGAITADEIAQEAQFFSFGTNDLTQMTCGFSRDDSNKFLKHYQQHDIIPNDPFQSLDTTGVGYLIRTAVQKGRSVSKGIKLGICGEHGGDPASISFCHQAGLNYVSCSPFRVPIARLAAAQSALKTQYDSLTDFSTKPKL